MVVAPELKFDRVTFSAPSVGGTLCAVQSVSFGATYRSWSGPTAYGWLTAPELTVSFPNTHEYATEPNDPFAFVNGSEPWPSRSVGDEASPGPASLVS
jgi:hypothetical protein